MDQRLMDSPLWWGIAAICYLLATGFAAWVERDYRRRMDLPQVTWKDGWLSCMIAAGGWIFVTYAARGSLPLMSTVPFAMAAAVLRGVFRVDRLTLLIPDRLQLLGALAGVLFVLMQASAGERWQDLALETGFALVMVVILWLLSALYFRVRQTVGFGAGDLKLLAWLALFVGKRMPTLVLLAVAFGVAWMAFQTLKKSVQTRKLALPGGRDVFAFGPAIVIACLVESLVNYGT